jgi:ankyrin repeat protein
MQTVDRIPDLIRATQNGDINEIRSLLDMGHDVDIKDSDNCTSLHWAADKGNLEIIKLLIDRGACVNAQDVDGMTPIEYAELADQEEAMQLIEQASCRQSSD